MKKKLTATEPKKSFRPPVVVVLGHVDHGKTTLLDTIRKTNVTAREYGGITQHIGAYQVEVDTKEGKNKITFIDTPGHQAFTNMRSRGASVADIAILVVSASDGVMPQTIESIDLVKKAGIPYIVALNKIDLSEANPKKVKGGLIKHGVELEGSGGDVPLAEISAKMGQGVKELLELILLVWEMNQPQSETNQFMGIIIESGLDKNRGPVATLIVRHGQIHVGEEIATEKTVARIRAIFDYERKSLSEAIPSQPIELLGFTIVPDIGSRVWKKNEILPEVIPPLEIVTPPVKSLEIPEKAPLAEKRLKVIIKTDTVGSLEAILNSLKSDDIEIIFTATGNITESDILLAKGAGAFVIGFNIKVIPQVARLAESEKVFVKNYQIIYELLDEIADVAKALREGTLEKILGEARIVAEFEMKGEKIAGVKVISGRIALGDQIKVIRVKELIGRAKIKSLKHRKEDITKAEMNTEAGLILSNKLDFLIGDSIISIG